uniref:LAGLIDADG endonuclease n=1 Tax=Pyronema omphalodes TaxID=337075 RepID=A0A140IMW8_9PEZI|nr:LAGLIDADG endonuclease [Pyronema omphalodes]AMO66526.1 LAGLIDADG endonuclease [Pyronema omphalodes]
MNNLAHLVLGIKNYWVKFAKNGNVQDNCLNIEQKLRSTGGSKTLLSRAQNFLTITDLEAKYPETSHNTPQAHYFQSRRTNNLIVPNDISLTIPKGGYDSQWEIPNLCKPFQFVGSSAVHKLEWPSGSIHFQWKKSAYVELLNNYTSSCPGGSGLLEDLQLPTPGEIEQISDHLKKHEKPKGEDEFGYYLAGLIEGGGYFGNQLLEILFFEKDVTLAYYIKKRIGYGSVYYIREKRACKYVLRHRAGFKYVLDLVNGKFLTYLKINQLLRYDYAEKFLKQTQLPPLKLGTSQAGPMGIILGLDKQFKKFSLTCETKANLCKDCNYILAGAALLEHKPKGFCLEAQNWLPQHCGRCTQNHWKGLILPPANFSLMTNHYLAGFTDLDGYFGISTPKELFPTWVADKLQSSSWKKSKIGFSVRLRFVLGQKDPTVLQKVKSEFGGSLYHYKSPLLDNYLLELSTYGENLKVIEYFDKFNLNSSKHLAFFKWRKTYRIVQRKEYLKIKGLLKIKSLGKSISELLK